MKMKLRLHWLVLLTVVLEHHAHAFPRPKFNASGISCEAKKIICYCENTTDPAVISIPQCVTETSLCKPCDRFAVQEQCPRCSITDACLCENGGHCLPKGGCACPENYYGIYCETKRRPKRQGDKKDITCPTPTDPDNGKAEFEFTEMRPGDAVKYKCNAGYTMIGYANRHCQDNGRFRGERPTCEKLCAFPVLKNSDGLTFEENPGRKDSLRDTSGNIVLAEIAFRCDSQYSISGPSTIRCQSGGKWDSDPPTCVKRGNTRPCPKPESTENIERTPTSANSTLDGTYVSGAAISFMCKPGHKMTGPATILCLDSGSWSSESPKCTPTEPAVKPPTQPTDTIPSGFCSKPQQVAHGKVTFRIPGTTDSERSDIVFPVGSSVEYECEHKYELQGENVRHCLADGKWSGNLATCSPVCGVGPEPKTPEIVGGTVAEQYGYPWQVGISTYLGNLEVRNIVCGGVILNERWVLTAAHCITVNKSKELLNIDIFKLYFGKHFYSVLVDDNDVDTRNAQQLIAHEDYNPWTFDSDLGLILLDFPLVFTDRIIPICLPQLNSMATFQEGNKGVVVGWGNTDKNKTIPDELMKVELPVVNSLKCSVNYQKLNFRLSITDNMFCAGLDEGGKNTCQGDSGGGMVFYEDTHYVLEGIVSWGNLEDCAAPGFFGAFVRVTNFVVWIRRYIG